MLANNNIETEEQFFSFYHKLKEDLIEVKGKRKELWRLNKNNYIDSSEDFNLRISDLNSKVKIINDDLMLCNKIQKRKKTIENDLRKLEEKEMINDEHIR